MITKKENIRSKYCKKTTPQNIGRKNSVMRNILELTRKSNDFLLLGHSYSDEDCVSSMVAAALLLRKFKKNANIYVQKELSPQLAFFANICRYNGIYLHIGDASQIKRPDVVIILDTPKASMVAAKGNALKYFKDSSIPKVEVDHHFTLDASYSGDFDYRLTLRASSACEIIAQVCYKLQKRQDILDEYEIEELYSRNIVLAMLTGMIGDAKYGNYLFKRRDKSFYNYFFKKLNKLLNEKYYKNSTNISSVDEISAALEALSEKEKQIYDSVIKYAEVKNGVGRLILDEEISAAVIGSVDYSQFLDIVKRITNDIAEKACGAGISIYYDPEKESDMIQFRIRASERIKGIDFRTVLRKFNITDGGGHPGAVGFRIGKKSISGFHNYVNTIIEEIEKMVSQME